MRLSEEEILAALKEDLRIDGDDMNKILTRKKAAAEEYLRHAGCKVDYSNPLYLEAVTRFVGRAIDNPENEPVSETGFSLVSMIEQLRLSQMEG